MRSRKTTVVSVVCGIACACCVLAYTIGVRGEADAARTEALERYGGEQMEVCVAVRDLAPGETIDAQAVSTKLWVADLLPENAVANLDDCVGQRVQSAIYAGEVVSENRLGSGTQLLEVPQGLTAVSVPAKDVQAIGGAVAPGMKVDLYATGDTSTSRVGTDVLVLATSTSSAEGEEASSSVTWVTVAVDPAMVQQLVATASKEQLYFTLPGTASEEEADAESAQEEKTTDSAAANEGGSKEVA